MLEKIIIFILIFFAIGFISWRISRTLKGDTCSGCASDCSSCNIKIPSVIQEENDIK